METSHSYLREARRYMGADIMTMESAIREMVKEEGERELFTVWPTWFIEYEKQQNLYYPVSIWFPQVLDKVMEPRNEQIRIEPPPWYRASE
jgi:hypothetical protein